MWKLNSLNRSDVKYVNSRAMYQSRGCADRVISGLPTIRINIDND